MSRPDPAQWLTDYLASRNGSAPASQIIEAAKTAGFSETTIKRHRTKAGVTSERRGFGQGSLWSLPTGSDLRLVHSDRSARSGQDTDSSQPDDVGGMLAAVNETVDQLEADDVDIAAITLARTYAAAIDNQGPLDVLGPRLLAVLESLCATPTSRAKLKGGVTRDPGDRPKSELDELRDRRDSRPDRAATMDPAAT